jgi:hypothetical protein
LPDAVGRQLSINGNSFTIVGVTRPQFFDDPVLRGPTWDPVRDAGRGPLPSNVSNSGDSIRAAVGAAGADRVAECVRPHPTRHPVAAAEDAITTVYQRDKETVLPKTATKTIAPAASSASPS